MMLAIVIPLSALGGGNYPSQGLPVYPSHPIAPGGPGMVDPGWGVSLPVDPGYGHPAWGGGHPSHPIYVPPVDPGYGRPGGGGAHPAHPIVIPPGSGTKPTQPIYVPSPTPPAGQEGYYLAYVPGLGQWVYIPVGTTKPPEAPTAEPK